MGIYNSNTKKGEDKMAKKTTKKSAHKSNKSADKKSASKKQLNRSSANVFGVYSASGLLVSIFLAIFIYFNVDDGGIIGGAIRDFLFGIFGFMAYFLPLLIGGVTIYYIVNKSVKGFWLKIAYGFGILVSVGAFLSIIYAIENYYAFHWGIMGIGGGVLSTAIATFLVKLVQKAATILILILFSIWCLSKLTNILIYSYLGKWAVIGAKKLWNYILNLFADLKENSTNNNGAFDEKTHRKRLIFKNDEDNALPEHNSRKRLEGNDVIDTDGIDEVFGTIENEKIELETPSEKEYVQEEISENQEDGEQTENSKVSKITDKEKEEFNKELDNAIIYEEIEYEYPDIDLLSEPASVSSDRREELRRTAEKLISVLADFGVKAKLLHVTQGPAVTRFEIQPDTGIKLSKIVGLADDIALNLAVQTVLVAPVPGKAAVGVEIPNTKVSMVSAREIIDSDEFKNAKSKLTVALGKDIGGNVIVGDIAKMPHVLIAGATGSGKSVCINTIVMSILYKAKPDEVKLIMVDPKVVELGVYNGIPHLLIPVVTDPKKAAGALNWAVAEMMRRYDRFKETGVRKIDAYNQLMEQTGGDKMPNLVIIIDELADLMMVAAKEVEDYICRLAQLARAAGIHLIIATQRPSVDVITGLIKANVPSRIAFSVSSQVDSRTILDRGGADKLLGMGDMLYHPMGARNAIRVQGAFVSDKEIEKVLSFIKENTGDTHYSEDLAEQIERCATGENGVTPDVEEDGDPLLQEAIALAVELGKISTSMIQRRLGVGYARAGRIVDQMEARGIISGANGSKPRDVLISHADMSYMHDEGYDDEE